MLLSSIPDQEIIKLYGNNDELPAMTSNSITSVRKLLNVLETTRQRGLAFDDCESNIDVNCVAAPVFNQNGETVAAISISVPFTRMSLGKQEELAELVRESAKNLSRRLGYRLR